MPTALALLFLALAGLPSAAATPDPSVAPSETTTPEPSAADASKAVAPTEASTPAPSVLEVRGFSSTNTQVIKAHEAALLQKLSAVTGGPGGIKVIVELASDSSGVVISMEEPLGDGLEFLGLIALPLGSMALDQRRAQLAALNLNAWLVTGPMRAAFNAGNMALAEAMATRAIVVQYTNARGELLSLYYTPYGQGQVLAGNAAYVSKAGKLSEIPLTPRSFILPQPRGADGAITPAAKLYAFFDVTF